MVLLTNEEVAARLDWQACVAAVEAAFRQHREARFGVLSLGHFHIKAGGMGGLFVTKINGNFPGNSPAIQGVVVVCDAASGAPVALMESGELTRRRTAAATAVAAKYLARGPRVVIVGYGAQGRAHHALFPSAMICDLGDPIPDADIVITCTPSTVPILHDVPAGTFIAAVGADHPEKHEIAPALMRRAVVITDVTAQARAFGDLHHAPDVEPRAELGDVITGARPGRLRDDEIVIFDSTGMALQDVAAASLLAGRPSPSA